jgi:hypothetical protein
MNGTELGSVSRDARAPVDVSVDPDDVSAVTVAYQTDSVGGVEVWSECVPTATGCTAMRRAAGSFGASPMVASSAALNATLLKTENEVRKCVHVATAQTSTYDVCGYEVKLDWQAAEISDQDYTMVFKDLDTGDPLFEFTRLGSADRPQIFEFCLACGTCVDAYARGPFANAGGRWWIIDESSEGWDDPLFAGTGLDVDDFCAPDCIPTACAGATSDARCFGVCEDFIACPSSLASWEPSALLVDDEKELVLVSDSTNDEVYVFDMEGNELYSIDVEATTSLALKPGVFAPLGDVSLATTW